MFRLLQNTIVLVLLMGLMTACGESYKAGQKVWIQIPTASISDEGYAIAKIRKTKGDKASVTILEVNAVAPTKFSQRLQKKRVSVPLASLSNYKDGLKRYQDKKKAYGLLKQMLQGVNVGSKKIDFVETVASDSDSSELTSGLTLYEIKKSMFNSKLSSLDKVENIPDIIDKLRSMDKKNGSYAAVLRSLNARSVIAYYLIAKKFLKVKAPIPDSSVKVSEPNLITRQSAKLIKLMRRELNQAEQGLVPALKLADEMSTVMAAEESLVRYVSQDGKRINISIKDIVKYRKKLISQSLRANLKKELIAKADLMNVKSAKAAENKYQAFASAAADLEKQLAIKIVAKGDRQNIFIEPVKRNIKRLKDSENANYKLAIASHRGFKAQRASIDFYLKHYPQGRNRDKVNKAKDSLEKRIEKTAALAKKKLDGVMPLFTSKKTFAGVAGYKKTKLKFKVVVNEYNKKDGSFSGRITWPGQDGAVNKITGSFDRQTLILKFKETEVIKKGSWRVGSKYKFKVASATALQGSHSYRQFVFPVKRPASIVLR